MLPMTIVFLGCERYNQMPDDIRVNLRLKLRMVCGKFILYLLLLGHDSFVGW